MALCEVRCGRDERAVKGKGKGGGEWLGREWLSVRGVVGERGGWFAFIRTWGERAGALCVYGGESVCGGLSFIK